METVKSILIHDETEESLQALNKKKKDRPKRRLINILTIVLAFLALSGMYFVSDFSKVKSLKVVGNYYFTDKEILELADLSYDSRHLLVNTSTHEKKAKENELIKNIKIDKTLSGVIVIEVEEVDMVGIYTKDKKSYLLLCDGESVEFKDEGLERRMKFPIIGEFSDEQRVLMAKSFAKEEKVVKKEIIALISEINPFKQSYDKHMIELVMQDGNRVHATYEDVYVLNYYKQMLKDLKEDNACIFLDALNGVYSTEDCKAFQ